MPRDPPVPWRVPGTTLADAERAAAGTSGPLSRDLRHPAADHGPYIRGACSVQADPGRVDQLFLLHQAARQVEQGTRQAREVGQLMASTATMLEESILATQQQKSAADQVDSAIQQIRDGADQLSVEQTQWTSTAERLDTLVAELDTALRASAGSIR